MKTPRITLFLSTLAALIAGACSPPQDDGTETAVQTSADCPQAQPPQLKNPGFAVDDTNGYPLNWLVNQHAGDKSYLVYAEGDVLVIDNTDKQYWFVVSQRHDISEWTGAATTFSAEIKMDLDGEGWPHTLIPGGGLQIIVRGRPPGGTSNKVVLHKSVMADEPRIGTHDWRTFSHSFVIPEGAESLEVGFLHQAHGKMWVRNPQLSVEPAAAQCGDA